MQALLSDTIGSFAEFDSIEIEDSFDLGHLDGATGCAIAIQPLELSGVEQKLIPLLSMFELPQMPWWYNSCIAAQTAALYTGCVSMHARQIVSSYPGVAIFDLWAEFYGQKLMEVKVSTQGGKFKFRNTPSTQLTLGVRAVKNTNTTFIPPPLLLLGYASFLREIQGVPREQEGAMVIPSYGGRGGGCSTLHSLRVRISQLWGKHRPRNPLAAECNRLRHGYNQMMGVVQ